MTALTRLALLSILATAVSAEFEYTVDVEKTLPERQTLIKNGEEFFSGEVINMEAKARFTRLRIENTKGLYFYVDASRVKPTPPPKDKPPTKGQKERKKEPVYCGGLPGIKAILKNDPKYKKKRYRFLLKVPQEVFCLAEIQIDMFPSGNGKAHMRINIVFKDSQNRHVGIVMNPFKPPNTKTDADHAKANGVLLTTGPIPQGEFSKAYLKPVSSSESQQSFLANTAWMNDVLKQAVFAESLYSGITQTYSEVYTVGPIIIPRGVYDNILRLDNDLERYAYDEGTTHVGNRYVYVDK